MLLFNSKHALLSLALLPCLVFSLYRPDYCNFNYAPKAIPLVKNATLKQLTIFHRHGDRIMYDGSRCWENDAMEKDFECDLSVGTMVLQRNASMIIEDGDSNQIFMEKFASTGDVQYRYCYVGQLTNRGYHMQFETGRFLRKSYVDTGFLSKNYNSEEIYLRADMVPRVIQSLEALVTGMYPDDTSIIKVVNTESLNFDPIKSFNFCPKAKVYQQEFQKADIPRKREIDIQHKKLSDQLRSEVGGYADDLAHLWDCMQVHLCHDFATPLSPKGVDVEKYVMDSIGQLDSESFRLDYSYPSVKERSRVAMGILIKEWFERWNIVVNSKKNDQEYEKFAEYSGHDVTLIALLTSLSFTNFTWPRYSSLIQLELYQSDIDGTHFMRFIYNQKVMALPFCLTNLKDDDPSNDLFCTYDDLEEYIKQIIPNNVTEACMVEEIPISDSSVNASNLRTIDSWHIMALLVCSVVILALGCGIGFFIGKRQNRPQTFGNSLLPEDDLDDLDEWGSNLGT